MEKRRRLSKEARREVLLDAALARFGAQGFAGARLEDIAADAGVTKQLLYRHFSDKTALYLALLDRHRADLSSFLGVLPETGTADERMRAVLAVWLDYVEAHRYSWLLLFRDSGGGPEIQAERAGVHVRAREVLVEFLRVLGDDDLPEAELEPLAELLSWGMASLVLWWIDNPAVPRDVLIDAIARVWRGVIP